MPYHAMEHLALHPKFSDLRAECLSFPDHAEQLFLVYLDLTQAKDFEDLHVIASPRLGRCLIEGTHPDNGNRYLVIPVSTNEPWTVFKLEETFLALLQEQDVRLKACMQVASKITLGIVASDSTITYLSVHRGVPN